MKVLVLGSEGRAHVLAWALDNSASVEDVVAAPGNPGIAALGKRCVPVDANDPAAVARLAAEVGPDLVVVSPEEPLVRGVADAVRAHGMLVFGPGADGARLEGSKAWMKSVLAEAGVPTARHAAFTADQEDEALAFLERLPGFYVVKTDGLAAGKGVVVTESLEEAREAVRADLSGHAFGDAGRTVVIEEGLTGPELSVLVVCNGTTEGLPLAPAQDFKRIGDGDRGPNTGGMGAYSPVPLAGPDVVADVMERAVDPTLHALAARDIRYHGVLYAGLMLTPEGLKVLEYNVRFGDPEAQAVLPRLSPAQQPTIRVDIDTAEQQRRPVEQQRRPPPVRPGHNRPGHRSAVVDPQPHPPKRLPNAARRCPLPTLTPAIAPHNPDRQSCRRQLNSTARAGLGPSGRRGCLRNRYAWACGAGQPPVYRLSAGRYVQDRHAVDADDTAECAGDAAHQRGRGWPRLTRRLHRLWPTPRAGHARAQPARGRRRRTGLAVDAAPPTSPVRMRSTPRHGH